MPNIKAAEKWMRRTAKRSTRNLDVKTRLKTLYKKAAGAGSDAARTVEAEFDKAARRGIIHPNKAARKKSRLAKAAAKSGAPAATAAKKPARKKAAPKTAAQKTGRKKAAK